MDANSLSRFVGWLRNQPEIFRQQYGQDWPHVAVFVVNTAIWFLVFVFTFGTIMTGGFSGLVDQRGEAVVPDFMVVAASLIVTLVSVAFIYLALRIFSSLLGRILSPRKVIIIFYGFSFFMNFLGAFSAAVVLARFLL